MAAYSLCHECDGTGWIPYRAETLDGELEEAYRLCPNCCAPPRCMPSTTDHPCSRPDVVRYGLDHYCKKHSEVSCESEGVENAYEALYYLRRWLWIARDKANELLEVQLSEALCKAETWLRHLERELDQACEDEVDPD
jgi:hypothetical protein